MLNNPIVILNKRAVQASAILVGIAAFAADGHATCLESPLKCEYIAFETVYTGEMWVNTSGGLQKGNEYVDNLDVSMEIDLEKAVGWRDATFFGYMIANSSADFSGQFTGDSQVVSNIDSGGTHAVRAYEVFLEQFLWDERVSLKAGLMDLNSEFDVIETAGLFINGSHGIGMDFGQLGVSIFPTTSVVAARAFRRYRERALPGWRLRRRVGRRR